jgi:hypothetical protein
MKKAIFFSDFFCLFNTFCECPAGAQSLFSVAPLIGTDIGGAVPIPFNAVGGSFNAYPKLNATLEFI